MTYENLIYCFNENEIQIQENELPSKEFDEFNLKKLNFEKIVEYYEEGNLELPIEILWRLTMINEILGNRLNYCHIFYDHDPQKLFWFRISHADSKLFKFSDDEQAEELRILHYRTARILALEEELGKYEAIGKAITRFSQDLYDEFDKEIYRLRDFQQKIHKLFYEKLEEIFPKF